MLTGKGLEVFGEAATDQHQARPGRAWEAAKPYLQHAQQSLAATLLSAPGALPRAPALLTHGVLSAT